MIPVSYTHLEKADGTLKTNASEDEESGYVILLSRSKLKDPDRYGKERGKEVRI